MAGSSLAQIRQTNFGRGMVRDLARHLIPEDGVWDLVNLMLDDGGSAYRRAGSTYKSNANAALGARVRCIWDGLLLPGARTFFSTDVANGFYVLGADDATPVGVGAGLGYTPPGAPARFKEHRGVLYGAGFGMYGGSRKTATYSTGTVAVTNGSPTVTGTGTLFLANVDVGMLVQVAGGPRYVVAAVVSDTVLTLKETYKGSTVAGAAYAATPVGSITALPPTTAPSNFGGTPLFFASIANRLVLSDGSARFWFSAVNDPTSFAASDWWEIPGGANVLGLERWRDQLLIFTTRGVWVLSGLALALTDPNGNVQQRLSLVHDDMILWGDAGIVQFQQHVVVPTLSGVYLVDAQGSATPVSSSYLGSINRLVMGYVRQGYRPGGAVLYEGHYYLPILSGDTVIDLLVARLDRPVYSWRGRRAIASYPWTRLAGHGANVLAFAQRSSSSTARPSLLAGSAPAARVLETRYTEPSAATKNDADGTTPVWVLETRDYDTGAVAGGAGSGSLNLVRRARLRYELIDAATDRPTVRAYYSIGTVQAPPGVPVSLWGSMVWGTGVWTDSAVSTFVQMLGAAPADDGRKPYTWQFGLVAAGGGLGPVPSPLFPGLVASPAPTGGVSARYVRVRFTSSDPCASLTIRDLLLLVRPRRKLT